MERSHKRSIKLAHIDTVSILQRQGIPMSLLKWAIILFIVSIIAGGLGFSGVSSAAGGIARILFFVFIVIAVLVLILGLTVGHAVF